MKVHHRVKRGVERTTIVNDDGTSITLLGSIESIRSQVKRHEQSKPVTAQIEAQLGRHSSMSELAEAIRKGS